MRRLAVSNARSTSGILLPANRCFSRRRFPSPAIGCLTLSLLMVALLSGCQSPLSGSGDGTGPGDATLSDSDWERYRGYDGLPGEYLRTERAHDLAIEGQGLFVLQREEERVYYRNPGRFILNPAGQLTLGNGEALLLGVPTGLPPLPPLSPPSEETAPLLVSLYPSIVEARQPFPASALEPISLAPFRTLPPAPTTSLRLSGNLLAHKWAQGGIYVSHPFLRPALPSDRLVGLVNWKGIGLGSRSGDTWTFSVRVNGGDEIERFPVDGITSLQDLATALETFLIQGPALSGPDTKVRVITRDENQAMAGRLCVYGNSQAIHSLATATDRPINSPLVTQAFTFPAEIAAGTERFTACASPLLSPAEPQDRLEHLLNAEGKPLGLEAGDEIGLQATRNHVSLPDIPSLIVTTGENGTRVQTWLDWIRLGLALPERDGTPLDEISVAMNAGGTDDNIPDGSLIIRGRPGQEAALTAVNVSATNKNGMNPPPSEFIANCSFTQIQKASDAEVATASAMLLGPRGEPYRLDFLCTATPNPGAWTWRARIRSEAMLVDTTGLLYFNEEARFSGFENGLLSLALSFNPTRTGSFDTTAAVDSTAPMSVTLIPDASLTQTPNLEEGSYLTVVQLGGYAEGTFIRASVDAGGLLRLHYSNGVEWPVYLIPFALFPTPEGLTPQGKKFYQTSTLSSLPDFLPSGLGAAQESRFKSGFLEFRSMEEKQQVCADSACRISVN